MKRSVLILVCGLLGLLSLGYWGYANYRRESEYNSLLANELSDFMIPLSRAVNSYLASSDGDLPINLPISKLFRKFDISCDYLPNVICDPDIRLEWNAGALEPSARFESEVVIAWMVNKKKPIYVCIMIHDKHGNIRAEIAPKSAISNLVGYPAIL